MPVVLFPSAHTISPGPGGLGGVQQQGMEDPMEIPVKANHHDHYWSEVKKDAAARMGQLTRGSRPSTEKEVHEALTLVLRHHTYGEAAEMLMLVNSWQQACHELKENHAD